MKIIEACSVTKQYRQYRRFSGSFGALKNLFTREYIEEIAVKDLSFSIEDGEAVGYLGPNGAGKSTMIKMMTGILVPSKGELKVLGEFPHKSRKRIAQQIGVVFGQRSQLWWDLPVIDSFDLHKYLYKISEPDYKKGLALYTDLLGIGEFINKPVRQLSLGQRMRVEIAISLLHEPRILFLDEPTIGLDVLAKDQIRRFLRTVNNEKKVTIFLTSHDMKDIEEICQRMIIVNKGNIIYDGTVTELREKLSNQRQMTIKFHQDPGRIEIPEAILTKDDGLRKIYLVERSSKSTFEIMNQLSACYSIEDFSIEDIDIDSVIRKLYQQLNEKKMESSKLG
ncbi:ABC transporter ATP-binding protein [Paenibacillus durus]|uniref:ABC transporter domain-containing protein n=1 Tax=Paenibacillus durus TaxID=44251 RepID=A0A089HSS7_PAEDU|nr:ATP-binding cassette domain-containing protein [Paenibacillus durus]AIQ15081.1 hypothetical protein PDUR_26810 [Paenibacillus durus]